ncbi:hypothetical protein [Alicyclobacillus tolerans]|uniref:Uncharacterized protein n=1 Tax=Alicyclobacillus tolerans TaxID=90970 RepID=A0A1M6LQ87_9BACL|nr:hypothetical protein [Alicyclobacillus montanus]SHJ73315.1 hypothetical protein SAMN05443507_10345 [Alicyclobacillus montanus]
MATKHEDYFEELRVQIMNPDRWDAERFIVFDHEPGLGKTIHAQRFVGEMTRKHPYRVLWVQPFKKDGLLDASANAINETAGKPVALAVEGEDLRTGKKRQSVIEPQVLVITTRMYAQVCKGEHEELIRGRDILLIDEYPNLMDEIVISRRELSTLYSYSVNIESGILDEMLDMFRDELRRLRVPSAEEHGHMIWMTFQSEEYRKYRVEINKLVKSPRVKDCRELLLKFRQLFRHEAYYHNGAFYTYDDSYDYVRLKNNIILDANADFFYPYQLSKRFVVKHQPKLYDYSQTTLHHYPVNTGKKGLKDSPALFDQVVKMVDLYGRKGVLFVVDKENKPKLEAAIISHYGDDGEREETLVDISRKLGVEISVEYHGNLLGRNDWRTFDTCVIVKTPNFDYGSYALMAYFFHALDKDKSFRNIELFRDVEVEAIRNSTIAAELFQAVKRINRDNSQKAEIYLFCSNEEAVGIVRKQLPGIKYLREPWGDGMTKCQADDEGQDEKSKLSKLKDLILKYKAAGVDSVRKQELRLQIGYSKSAFSHRLSELKSFLEEHDIINDGQRLRFQVQGGGSQAKSDQHSRLGEDTRELVTV